MSRSRAQSYLETSSRWLTRLLAICHLTSGAPARGTEINQVIWCNTSTNPRNLFLDPVSHTFLIRLAYSKTFTRSGQEKDAIRALPQSVSYLLLAYLAYVRPFEEALLISLNQQLPEAHFLLFWDYRTSRPFSSKVLSRTLKSLTNDILSQRINIRIWRHVMQGFIRHGLGLSDTLEDPTTDEIDDEGLGADQMNHSRATGLAIYGRSVASFQGVRADIQAALISFSQRWHTYLGVSSDQLVLGSLFYNRAILVPTILVPTAEQEPSQRLQPKPSTLVLPLDQPVVQFRYPSNPRVLGPTYKVSIGQFNEFMSLYKVPQAAAPQAAATELANLSDLDAGQKIRQLANSPLVGTSLIRPGLLTQLLREFLSDDKATFRSTQQEEAFYHMMKHVPYLILILPTAAGKTTLFLFGASLFDNQVTIIVVPLISLKLDLLGKANTLGLNPTVWDPLQVTLPADSRVILVQIEYVVYPSFQEMANILINQRRLARVIWDECHLIPLSKSYRPIMYRAWHALALRAPMVFASATLPRHLEEELCQMLQLGKQPQILRAKLTLKHMTYRVSALPDSLAAAEYPGYISQFIKQFNLQYGPFGLRADVKVIIFCRTKALVDRLFDALQPQAARFHASLSDDEKLSQLDHFRQEASILLATSGIGAGYDFPDVNLVIHFMPGAYEITNFMQESGRAGRSPSSPAWSYCLVQRYQLNQLPQADLVPQASAEKVFFQHYLTDQICRRRVISRVFDGEALEVCDPLWAQCDRCSDRLIRQSVVVTRVSSQQRQNLGTIDFLVSAVKFWTEQRCPICFIRWLGKCSILLPYYYPTTTLLPY